jgi:anti-anti-sigma regulatory factor
MLEIAPGWQVEVDRGPDWLFIKLHSPDHPSGDEPPLADFLWSTIAAHFTYRVVLEMCDVGLLHSYLVGQLVLLHKRLCTHGGVLRMCGLSDGNQNVLNVCRLDSRFPQFRDRVEAVHGYHPTQPR